MWWRTAYSSLYRHPVHALHQYEVRAEHLAGYVCMEARVITGYALYAVAVGLTGSMYMVSITAGLGLRGVGQTSGGRCRSRSRYGIQISTNNMVSLQEMQILLSRGTHV